MPTDVRNAKRARLGRREFFVAFIEGGWGIARKKDCHLREKLWLIAQKSRPKAVIAIAHDVLVLAYFVLLRGTAYEPNGVYR